MVKAEIIDGAVVVTYAMEEIIGNIAELRRLGLIKSVAEPPWAAAERALDEAVASGKIEMWRYEARAADYLASYYVSQPNDQHVTGGHRESYRTRAAAAQLAAHYVATLPAPKPAKRDIVTMTCHDIECELKTLGFRRVDQALPCFTGHDYHIPMNCVGEDYTHYLRRALSEARDLAVVDGRL